ncbi:MAG: site-specific DNA-methyltransferase, partial [Desulfobacterales bacterium]|nr:site-specific DNA-methyltransferase [Desulfobacterales bacterium]
IDPPYNTGNDFIYKDNFKTSREEYEECIGAVDEDGGRLFKNTDSNGRFHSDWLSMMYERLLIARDLLKEDGVIFISIDDNEVHNLRKICDEIFGEGNKVGVVIWKNVTDNNPTNIAMEHEYILCYAKQKTVIDTVWKSKVADAKEQLIKIGINLNNRFKNQEELQTAYTNWFRENKRFLGQLDRYKYIDKGGIYTGSQSVHNPGKEGYRYDVIHPVTKKPCKQPLMGYRFPEQTMKNLLDKGKILFGKDDFKIIEIKVYVEEYEDKLSSVIEMDGRLGAYNLRDIFIENKKIFDNSKPEQLLKTVFSYILNYEDLILDFFSGSATTAHAVMQLNAEDNGNRQFIMVQLPEKTDEKSEAYKAGYKTIADIGKERIRRAGKKIKEENKGNEGIEKLDIGFRVYKTDTSNMKDVYYHPEQLGQREVDNLISNIKQDRTPDDLLTQVILDLGLELNLPIEKKEMLGNTVFIVQTNALVACFDDNIHFNIVDIIANLKPLKVVFKDGGFKDDKDRINLEERFKRLSPETVITVI